MENEIEKKKNKENQNEGKKVASNRRKDDRNKL